MIKISLLDCLALLGVAGIILIFWQLSRIGAYLHQMMVSLYSLDSELFHLAQEQNPDYGICDSCGRRDIVRHVISVDDKTETPSLDMFYCKSCWWRSDSVKLGSDDKHYKYKLTEQDEIAAQIGPG